MKKTDAVLFHDTIVDHWEQKYQNNSEFIDRHNNFSKVFDGLEFSPSRILDLGCGTGHFSFMASDRWPKASVVGVDASFQMIEFSKQKKSELFHGRNIEFIQSDAINYLEKNRNFDLIVSSSLIEYMPDYRNSINKICSSLMVGGFFVYSIPNKQSLYRKFEALLYLLVKRPKYYAHVCVVSDVENGRKILKEAGFCQIENYLFSPTSFCLRFTPDNLLNEMILYVAKKDG